MKEVDRERKGWRRDELCKGYVSNSPVIDYIILYLPKLYDTYKYFYTYILNEVMPLRLTRLPKRVIDYVTESPVSGTRKQNLKKASI